MRKKTIVIVVLLVILAVALIIPNITFSKYVSESTDFDMVFSSAPFYFDAALAPGYEYNGPNTVLMYSVSEVELTINVYNYIGANVTEQDINYSISLKESNQVKFALEGETERTLVYNGAQVDSVNVTLSKKEIDYFPLENITILITSTEPFAKTIQIPLGVYTRTYQEYDLSYEIHLGDEVISTTDENFAEKSLAGNTIDSIFGSGRLTKIVNFSFYFTVTIPANYTAKVYWNDTEINVNDGWDLGVDPVYDYINGKIQPNTDKGPSSLKLEHTGYLNNAAQDFTISVHLTEKFTEENEKVPVFDASYWLSHAEGAEKRGSTGIDRGPTFNKGNIDTLDGWDWTNRGTMRETPQPMTKQDNGTYSFEWTFQTNTLAFGAKGYILDVLELNGTAINIPFAPGGTVNSDNTYTEHPNADNLRTTVLPDGTVITVEYVREFNNNSQRVYTVTVSNARSDITVTNGNLMMSNGAPEIVVYSLVGIESNEITVNSDVVGASLYSQSSVIIMYSHYTGISFKLQSYYHKPTAKITDTAGNVLQTYTVTLNRDGWYEITDFDPSVVNSVRLGLLYVEAEPMQFAIQYNKGNVEDATWEYLDGAWYDDNAGRYYTVENSRIFSISEYTPVDPSGVMEFAYWKIGSEVIQVGQIFDFSEFAKYAVENEDGIFVVTLEAVWKAKDT